MRVLCGSLENLANAFADLDQKALDEATPLEQNNRNSELKRRVRLLLDQEGQSVDVAPQMAGAPETVPISTVV